MRGLISFQILLAFSLCLLSFHKGKAQDGPVEWKVDTQWDVNEWGVDGIKMSAIVRVTDAVDQNSQALCGRLDYVQVVKASYIDEVLTEWRGSESVRARVRTSKGYFVDHSAARCRESEFCSPYYNDHFNLVSHSVPNTATLLLELSNSSEAPAQISMEDFPHGFAENKPFGFDRFEAQTCLVCEQSGEIKGCASWGGEFPPVGDDKVLYPVLYKSSPDSNFLEALALFRSFYPPSLVKLSAHTRSNVFRENKK